MSKAVYAHAEGIQDGQIIALNQLLADIKASKLTEIYQVEFMINNTVKRLMGEQYEVDANADHATESQFNGQV